MMKLHCRHCAALVALLGSALFPSARAGSFDLGDSAVSGKAPVIENGGKDAAEPAEEQRWLFHVQGTEVVQGQPGFSSPYTVAHGITPGDNVRQTSSFDLFFGARLWPGGELYFNPEFYQGFGFASAHGIAAFPNADAYKVGQHTGDVFIPHLYYRQTFGLGGEQEQIEGDLLQLAEKVDISRITLTVGRLAVGDQFDGNAYAHDPQKQFLNWVLVDAGAFDYAADSLGFVEGMTLELNQKRWALRYGIFDVPRVSNGEAIDGHYLKAWQQVLEWEGRFALSEHPGKVRWLGWLESANMGSYREVLGQPALDENIALTRRYRYQYGFELNLEQEITQDLGAFLRLSWRDGQQEIWQFTDVDDGLSLGLQLKGEAWGRKDDHVGLAEVLDGITAAHKEFLAAGGLGPLVGDGQLKHYGLENVVEAYYDAELIKHVHAALDYQLIANPGYNADRGPIHVFSARLHLEF